MNIPKKDLHSIHQWVLGKDKDYDMVHTTWKIPIYPLLLYFYTHLDVVSEVLRAKEHNKH